MKTITKLWMLIIILASLAPIGLVLPAYLKAGAAWGEWGLEEIKWLVGYVPHGFMKLSSMWGAPMPDYAFKNWEGRPLAQLGIAYVISAIVGILVVAGIVLLVGRFLSRKDRP